MQSYLISLMTLSISLFAVSALIVRPHRTQAHIFLCLVLLSNAISYVWLVARGVGVPIIPLYRLDALEFLSGYLMLPALWFYAKALTSGAPVTWRRGYFWHAVPLSLAALMVSILQIVPHDARLRLIDGPVPLNNLEFVAGFLLEADAFIFPVLLLGYVLAIVRRLSQHRSRLKDLYASTESRELTWINWMMVLFAIDWGISVSSEISDMFWGVFFYGPPLEEGLDLATIWILALWGLRQRPPLAAEDSGLGANAGEPKYGRSALSEDIRTTISEKVETAMAKDQLYLDPNLSLVKLARHIATPPNQVSQTLNAAMGPTFFDYVNGHRVRAVLPRIRKGSETVIAIAYDAGFNSRSAFYDAFKRETGVTPSAYRSGQGETASPG